MRISLIATVLVFASSLLWAGERPEADRLLAPAVERANIFASGSTPFELDLDFTAQLIVPASGHLRLLWQAEDRWWQKIDLGEFEQITIRNGDRLYTKRNLDFTPIRITELIGLTHFPSHFKDVVVKKKARQEDGIELTCLVLHEEGGHVKSHQACLDQRAGNIASESWESPPDEHRTERFSDYFDFRTLRYPRNLELLVNGNKVISANVTSLGTATPDSALLVPPPGAVERRQCKGLKRPLPVHTPDPVYPKSASENRIMGDSTVAMTVQTDGSVSDIHLIGSATHSMDDASLKTLKTWKFKPAMCGSEPVVSDIEVVVSFRLE